MGLGLNQRSQSSAHYVENCGLPGVEMTCLSFRMVTPSDEIVEGWGNGDKVRRVRPSPDALAEFGCLSGDPLGDDRGGRPTEKIHISVSLNETPWVGVCRRKY